MISRGIGKSAARSVARSLSQFGSGGVAPSYDTDAQTYITAVEAADGQSLETGVKDAINAFVVGCKADGIWTAIKASCILAGARTLTGALVPLVGTAPTNNNFVSGDYSRTAGLTGDGSTKYLDSNRNNDADPQDSKHISVYVSAIAGATNLYIGARDDTDSADSTQLAHTTVSRTKINSNSFAEVTATPAVGFFGGSRATSSTATTRANGTSVTASTASASPGSRAIWVFARNSPSSPVYSASSLTFYSIGESLDLALLDSRVTTLITDIGTALA